MKNEMLCFSNEKDMSNNQNYEGLDTFSKTILNQESNSNQNIPIINESKHKNDIQVIQSKKINDKTPKTKIDSQNKKSKNVEESYLFEKVEFKSDKLDINNGSSIGNVTYGDNKLNNTYSNENELNKDEDYRSECTDLCPLIK